MRYLIISIQCSRINFRVKKEHFLQTSENVFRWNLMCRTVHFSFLASTDVSMANCFISNLIFRINKRRICWNRRGERLAWNFPAVQNDFHMLDWNFATHFFRIHIRHSSKTTFHYQKEELIVSTGEVFLQLLCCFVYWLCSILN